MELPTDIEFLRKDAEYRRFERESLTYSWRGTEDQQWHEGKKACIDRRKVWGQGNCDERGSGRGSCAECKQDIAEALETDASKVRRAAAVEAMEARATTLRDRRGHSNRGDREGGDVVR